MSKPGRRASAVDVVDSGHLKDENAKLQAEIESLKKQAKNMGSLKSPDGEALVPSTEFVCGSVMIFMAPQ